MRLITIIAIALLSYSIGASANDLFVGKKPIEYVSGTPLEPSTTIGGYPIYQGVDWKLYKVSANQAGTINGADAVQFGTVVLTQNEPDGSAFGVMLITANINETAKNQYLLGDPCSGAHLVAVNKGGGVNDNCLTIDVKSYQSNSRTIPYFDISLIESDSGGRMLRIEIRLNADMFGFRDTLPINWAKESVDATPAKKIFVTKLRKWAELIQDASHRAVDYSRPKNVYDSIPSYKTLVNVPDDLADGSFSQQFISAVEHVRNASNFKAIAYTKLELQKVKWAYSDGRENQLDADTRALEVCNTGRPEASEPCRLYDLSTPVSQ